MLSSTLNLSSHDLQRRLAEEYERCQQYLDAGTRRPLVGVVEAQLLQVHMCS